jgi:hypothetical protein
MSFLPAPSIHHLSPKPSALSQSLQNKALVVSNNIMNVFDKGDAAAVRKARKLAKEIFGEGWEAKGTGIYDEGDKEAQIWGIGQSWFTSWLILGGMVLICSLVIF